MLRQFILGWGLGKSSIFAAAKKILVQTIRLNATAKRAKLTIHVDRHENTQKLFSIMEINDRRF